MKKNVIIYEKIIQITLVLLFVLFTNITQAVTVDEVTKQAKAEQKQIQLPNFAVTDTFGNVHTNKSTKGKYLIVNFWATWCPPCLKEIPTFTMFYQRNKDKVQVLGLDYEDINKRTITKFIRDFNINYPVILFNEKNEEEFAKFGDIKGMPTTNIYDENGKLIDSHAGIVDIKFLERSIKI